MYNRSPRFGLVFPGGTPPEVGPYTYMLDDPLISKRVNVVPFASTSERNSTSAHKKYTDALYNIRENTCSAVGGHSLRNKAERFIYKASDVPPPGTYNPKYPGSCKKTLKITPGKGCLYLCKVPYSLIGSAPSIPTKIDQNGYDIGPQGKIIKNKVISRQRVVGPASYNIDVSSCVINNPHSGCHWSRRTSKRDMFGAKQGPGPGYYSIEKSSACRVDMKEEEYREMARRFSFTPRFIELQQFRAQRLNYPSPAHYDKPSSFDYKPPVTTIIKPFINKKPRFEESKEREESFHAIYDTAIILGEKPTPSIKRVPFSIAAERFKKKKKSIHEPQPEFRRAKGFTDRIIEKNMKPYALFRPPFDSTVGREINFVAYDSHLKPDCAVYPREELAADYKFDRSNSVFASHTERIKIDISAAPPATRYDVMETFNANKNKTSHQKKKLPFMATSERKTVILPHRDNPGPADYLGKEGSEGKGFIFDKTIRFKEKGSDIPPPDHYYIHPLYRESIFRAKDSFNLMIAESILKKKLRLPPKETYKDFMKILKRKKTLRCYASVLED